jgi:hypothetical protein
MIVLWEGRLCGGIIGYPAAPSGGAGRVCGGGRFDFVRVGYISASNVTRAPLVCSEFGIDW